MFVFPAREQVRARDEAIVPETTYPRLYGRVCDVGLRPGPGAVSAGKQSYSS